MIVRGTTSAPAIHALIGMRGRFEPRIEVDWAGPSRALTVPNERFNRCSRGHYGALPLSTHVPR